MSAILLRNARVFDGRDADCPEGMEVLVVERGQDRYQRTLGRVYRGDLDVNAEQVRQGMAWVYRQYSKDASLYQIEAEAKEQKRGLWRDPAPVPPWEWRKDRR